MEFQFLIGVIRLTLGRRINAFKNVKITPLKSSKRFKKVTLTRVKNVNAMALKASRKRLS